MIKMMRVDHRLLHGQVALTWTQNLGVDAILIANDDVVVNDLRKTTLKLAKPQGVKLVLKSIADSIEAINSGVTDKYKLLIVVETITDAHRLATTCAQIQHVNLGGTKSKPGTRALSNLVNAYPEEEVMLKELVDKGLEVEIRTVPGDSKINVEKVL